MIVSESYIMHVSYGKHHINVSVNKIEFNLWIDELKQEFSVHHTLLPDSDNQFHIHSDYYLVNYHGDLYLIGSSDIFYDYLPHLDDLPFDFGGNYLH